MLTKQWHTRGTALGESRGLWATPLGWKNRSLTVTALWGCPASWRLLLSGPGKVVRAHAHRETQRETRRADLPPGSTRLSRNRAGDAPSQSNPCFLRYPEPASRCVKGGDAPAIERSLLIVSTTTPKGYFKVIVMSTDK